MMTGLTGVGGGLEGTPLLHSFPQHSPDLTFP